MSPVCIDLSTVRLLSQTHSNIPRHFQSCSTFWCLTIVQQGEVSFYADSRSGTARTGDALLFPPRFCHAVHPLSEETYTSTLFFTAVPIQGAVPRCMQFFGANDPVISSILSVFGQKGLQEPTANKLLEALLCQLMTLSAEELIIPDTDTLSYQILCYLNEHFQDDISLPLIAAAFRVTPGHVIHTFKPLFELSPIQYLIQRRIGEAQKLLLTTEYMAGDIAGLVGICNRNHFYNTFKRLVGMTPSLFRTTIIESTAFHVSSVL